ncbi:MAG: BrnT family toxin [Thermoanaerobaculales bacterium]
MDFEWDSAKDRGNRQRHGVSFDETKELFSGDGDYLEVYDAENSHDEDRFIAIGPIQRGLVLVVYTERLEETIRIISARWATHSEACLFRRFLGGD